MPSTSTTPTPINTFFQVFMVPISSARLNSFSAIVLSERPIVGSIRDKGRPKFPNRYSSPCIYLRCDERQSSRAPVTEVSRREADCTARFPDFERPLDEDSTTQPFDLIIACRTG